MLVWMKQGFLNPETLEQCDDFVCLKLASSTKVLKYCLINFFGLIQTDTDWTRTGTNTSTNLVKVYL